jgi:hypothetical protein
MLIMAVCMFTTLTVGCRTKSEMFPPLTHSVSMENAGSGDTKDVWLSFGEHYEIGWLGHGAKVVIYRTGSSIPSIAQVKWRRDDRVLHQGQVKVEKPADAKFEPRYHILIHDDDSLSFFVEELKDRPLK